jgi:predicted nucleic acid-binding protein
VTLLVVDASVWVAAADTTDPFTDASRQFLAAVAERHIAIAVPELATLELVCALARRLRNAEQGRALGASAIAALDAQVHAVDAALIADAVALGTAAFLRATDALYAALALRLGAPLVAWDRELVERAGAVTPVTWMLR